ICCENTAENDVLNVFGFTSEQTVVNLTGKILRSETAPALDVLYQQCEAGKDMMRLMSDLISYLRDLLVFKAKPDALQEDVDPELQKVLAAQAELIQNDRLLDLIDQFAEAEGRMKWAPNKKLHFEVALIKAIQSLSEVTLNEVIENLNALRDGKDVTTKKAVAGIGDAGREELRPGKTGVADPGYNRTESPRVSETAPTIAPTDANELWRKILAKIPQKGFWRTLTESGSPIGLDARNFLLGHPPGA